MARKTGRDVRIEVEVGTTFYAMSALSTVSSPAADVGKKFTTDAEFLSGQEGLLPDVRLDGVISGLNLSPGTGYNSVGYTEGSVYIKGVQVDVVAGTVTGLLRPTTSAQVRVTALTVDENGAVNKTVGTAGTTSNTRGAAGAIPYLPVDEVLIGYITMTYYDGSASGAKAVVAGEVNNETKERSTTPSVEVLYHDGSGNSATEVGAVAFASALPEIHAAAAAGPGTARRNVYCAYYEPGFEQLPNARDFDFDEDITTVKSKAYLDSSEEVALSTPMWSGRGTVYWDKVNDVLSLIKNSIRWIKYFPDKDGTEYWAGRCVFKVSRAMPVEDTLNASITLEGSGELYAKS